MGGKVPETGQRTALPPTLPVYPFLGDEEGLSSERAREEEMEGARCCRHGRFSSRSGHPCHHVSSPLQPGSDCALARSICALSPSSRPSPPSRSRGSLSLPPPPTSTRHARPDLDRADLLPSDLDPPGPPRLAQPVVHRRPSPPLSPPSLPLELTPAFDPRQTYHEQRALYHEDATSF